MVYLIAAIVSASLFTASGYILTGVVMDWLEDLE